MLWIPPLIPLLVEIVISLGPTCVEFHLLVLAYIYSANLKGACLRNCTFRNADLKLANLDDAKIRNANMEGANNVLVGSNTIVF